jgi:hypothetical protein
MIQARVRIGKRYAATELPEGTVVPAHRSDEIVVTCGKRDRNGHQTCRGDFGVLDIHGRGRTVALWGIFRFDEQRGTWRPTHHAIRQGNRGATPGLRRAVALRPTTRGGARDRARFGVHAQDYVEYGRMGERIVTNPAALPIVAECPRCSERQELPITLMDAADALAGAEGRRQSEGAPGQ